MSPVEDAHASGVEGFIARHWGKARDPGRLRWHPLAYHQADVAACAAAIADARPWMLEWMADRLGRGHGWDAAAVRNMIEVFAYAHDAGKHAVGFQILAPHAFKACTGGSPQAGIAAARNDLRHDALGLLAWVGMIRKAPNLTEALIGAAPDHVDAGGWLPIASATFGHHGHPTDPEAEGVRFNILRVMFPRDVADACESCASFRRIAGGFPGRVDGQGAKTISIPFAGLVQVADWMGSSHLRSDYADPDLPLAAYRDQARAAAARIAGELGLVPARPAPWRGVEPIVAPYSPTPMQAAAAGVALNGPFLAILEDTMGSGKTEAAVALAARAMDAGLSHGLFVGLPTTATADGQARRQAALRRVIFMDGGVPPSFAVAHGRSDPRRWPADPDGAPLPGSWITDERRLRLLADLCVGTVDQALLGVMNTEFSAVRRFALLGKVLVIDEVHAYDSYTLRLVEDLVREHAALDGSVILLSATLTAEAKRRLLGAFQDGLGRSGDGFDDAADPDAPYPALTTAWAGGATTVGIDKAPTAPPDKDVVIVHTEAEAEAALLSMAGRGGCAAWIRLTVDGAINSAVAIAARHGDVTALHSRMPASQRSGIETALLARFGKGREGAATTRAGGIVVATSVIAASLDVDFDLVVVDIRGMDEVLQAFGRGRRHRRAADGRVLPPGSTDLRPATPMLLLSPNPDEAPDEGWLERLFGWAGAKVAGNAARAWRTARLLRDAGRLRYGDERRLVEAATCRTTVPTPPSLADGDDQHEAGVWSRRGLARQTQNAALRVRDGYVAHGPPPGEDEALQTRIDEIDAVEVLLVADVGRVQPLSGANGDWADGRIRIPVSRFAEGGLGRAREIAAKTGLPTGMLAVPLVRHGEQWTHDGGIMWVATLDPRWGLRWVAPDAPEVE